MFKRILIARRSAAANRVAQTCRRLEIDSIGVHSEPKPSHYVQHCDQQQVITLDGALLAAESLIAAASALEVDAIHPGFCDSRDDSVLSRHFEAAGLAYIGLDPDAMETVRSGSAFRECVERAAARAVPASKPVNSLRDADHEADQLGYPVVLRSVIADADWSKVLHDEEELAEAWAASAEQYERDTVIVERWFMHARTIEVLVAADSEGVVMQIVESEVTRDNDGNVRLVESPSPALTFRNDGESLCEMMYDLSIRVAKELGTIGLIRIEFLLTADGRVYVAGARFGLPSLHSPIEKVTHLDLVELQLRLAMGEPLPREVLVLQPNGHAVGACLSTKTEDGSGPTSMAFPSAPARSVSIERVAEGGEALPEDDGRTIALVTSFAPIRHQALLTLDRILAGARIEGAATNLEAIRRVLASEAFRAGSLDRTTLRRLN